MIPFNCSEYVISNRIELTVLDIEHLTGAVKSILDKNFVSICEGSSGTDLVTAKKEVANLYARKDEDWKIDKRYEKNRNYRRGSRWHCGGDYGGEKQQTGAGIYPGAEREDRQEASGDGKWTL